jgi:tRNA nucleotidyltransferase (CCA-adding enzyme)
MVNNKMKLIPQYIIEILKAINKAGFSAELVGGSVRNLLLNQAPKDFDITSSALPEEILKLFKDSKYNNEFGTVILPIKDKDNKLISVVEITTYRSESNYSDHRRPDNVKFESDIKADLRRRDFTINAMALRLVEHINDEVYKFSDQNFLLIDLFKGRKDIKEKIIRAVGEPESRFKEDALRMLRAVRFCVQLNFSLEPKTQRAIVKLAGSLKFIAKERIRDEFIKILASNRPDEGINLLFKLKLLNYIIPELLQGDKVKQNHHHIYSVLKHNLLSLKYCPNSDWRVRLASLLHDIGKPRAKKIINGQTTFYNHEYIGAKMVDKIMTRLRFSLEDKEKVVNLVRNHMFYYNVDEVTATSVRRLIKKVGKENLADLIDLRVADRLGSGTPKAMPYKLRHLQYMMDKVQNDPVSVKSLKINGHDLINQLSIKPGPQIGTILDVLLGEVIVDPEKNKKLYLKKRAKELLEYDLKKLRNKAKDLIEGKRDEDDKKIKNKFKVK